MRIRGRVVIKEHVRGGGIKTNIVCHPLFSLFCRIYVHVLYMSLKTLTSVEITLTRVEITLTRNKKRNKSLNNAIKS